MDQAVLQSDMEPVFSDDTSCSKEVNVGMEQTSTTTLPQSSIEVSPTEARTCQWAGCLDKRVFRQESAFRRHMNKHERPYKCTHSNCKVREFTNPGDLKRHQRTVHSNGTFFCPILSCRRHGKGFGRKDNRDEHLKRVHSQEASSISDSPEKQAPDTWEDIRETSIAMSDDGAIDMIKEQLQKRNLSLTTSRLPLVAKLQELKEAKATAIAAVDARFDKDIEALERVLSFT